jgi:lysophospholipase L1-like esterase
MPGISVSKIPIPFRGAGGISWQTYWATLISATVENAAPTHVVLTFPTAQTSLGATDFTVAGFTISSASWTGAILTLVLSTNVKPTDKPILTFTKIDAKINIVNNVYPAELDTNTLVWYRYGAGIAKDVSNKISAWNDLSGNDHHLSSSGTAMPTFDDGVLFDGIANYMKTANFVFNQPFTFYGVFKLDTPRQYDTFWTSNSSTSCIIWQPLAGDIEAYAGNSGPCRDNMIINIDNNYFIVRVVFNGATSVLTINTRDSVTGNAGTNNMNGITLGANYNLLSRFINAHFRELIFRDGIDSNENQLTIYNYLNAKNNLKPVVAIFGDSITAGHSSTGRVSIKSRMSTARRIIDSSLEGAVITDLINWWEHQVRKEAQVDVTFVLIGINNVSSGQDTPTIITAYQELIDKIRNDTGASNKIIAVTLIPSMASKSQDQQYIDLNNAIRGTYATPITNIDGYIDTVATALNAGDGTLAAIYDEGDGLHENTLGRQLIADLYDAKIEELGF